MANVKMCDFCLGGIDGKPALRMARWNVGWRGIPRMHACDDHKTAHHNVKMEPARVSRRVLNRSMCGQEMLMPSRVKTKSSVDAYQYGLSKVTILEPYWGRAGAEQGGD